MIKHTQALIKTLYRPFVGLVFAFIMLFGIGFGGFKVEATNGGNYENAYIRFDSFYYDDTDDLILEFFVKTTFSWKDSNYTYFLRQTYLDNSAFFIENPFYNNVNLACDPDPVGGQLLAGQTYKIYLKYILKSGSPYQYTGLTKSLFETLKGSAIDADDYLQNYNTTYNFFGNVVPANTIFAYYEEKPILDITFPLPNAEISEAFYITGSYTIPETSGITKLIAFFTPVGLPYPTYSFHQNLIYFSGDVNIRSSGIQADDYTIELCFVGLGIEAICLDDQNIDISIVSAIPPELPETQETPPEVFDPVDADQFYLDFSGYETPTAMYNNLKNAIQPIFITIGSNLTFFTSRFDSEIAKDTGEKTGQAILIIRSYSSNLNTFFNDLPVSEFLIFYLTLLIVVIVFRIIKNLINLIKP